MNNKTILHISAPKIIIITILISILITSLPVSAGIFDTLPSNCREKGNCTVCDFIQTFINLEKLVMGLLGSLALLFFIYGGLKYILSRGNSESVTAAQNIIINTIVGIALVLLAWLLVNFIVLAMTGQANPKGVSLIFDSKEWYRACISN